MKISIGVSNHHVHVTREVLDIIYGKDYELTVKRLLNQKGQFASEETVTLEKNGKILEHIRIVGPVRNYTQVEISKTDAFKLGINPPVRESGDITGSEKVTLVGPEGTIDLDEGCIIATRHIHLTNDDVKKYNLEGKKYVDVYVKGLKGGLLRNVSLKVNDNYVFELHIDTDDANAHLINQGDIGYIIKDNANE